MSMSLDDIIDLVHDVEGERTRFNLNVKTDIDMWELKYWTEEQRAEGQQEGREHATDQSPRNIVGLAMRLIANEPQISCPIMGVTSVEEANARSRERFLKTLWQVQGNAQTIDPLSALKWNILVPSRAALKVLWVRESLPKAQRDSVPPIRFMPLDPTMVGIAYGDLYPKLAYHKLMQKARVVQQQFPDAKLMDGRKKRQYKPNEIVTLRDVWWIDDDTGKVWQAVLLDDSEFVLKPVETEYNRLPIIERKNDPVPLSGEHRNSPSILAQFREHWPISNQLLSMHFTAVATHLWPETNVVNENNEEVPLPESGMGAFNQFPPGTRYLERQNSRPDIGLLQSLQQDLQQQRVMGSFAPELYGKAPETRTAGYAQGALMEAAQGRIADTVYQLERLLIEANEIALCLVERFAGSKGVTIYGYSAKDQQMFSASLNKQQIMGAYQNSVSLSKRLPSDRLQMLALALQMMTANVLSARTIRRDYVPLEVPEDEEVQVMAEQVLKDPNLLAAIVREAAMLQGIELPQGEPDWKDTPPAPPPPPNDQPQGVQQPPMPMPQAPEANGGITPEMFQDPSMSPGEFDQVMGQQVSPEQALMDSLIAMGQAPGRDSRPRP